MTISIQRCDRREGGNLRFTTLNKYTAYVLLAIVVRSSLPDVIATDPTHTRARADVNTKRQSQRNRLRNDWAKNRIERRLHKTWRLFRLRCCSLNTNRWIYSMGITEQKHLVARARHAAQLMAIDFQLIELKLTANTRTCGWCCCIVPMRHYYRSFYKKVHSMFRRIRIRSACAVLWKFN